MRASLECPTCRDHRRRAVWTVVGSGTCAVIAAVLSLVVACSTARPADLPRAIPLAALAAVLTVFTLVRALRLPTVSMLPSEGLEGSYRQGSVCATHHHEAPPRAKETHHGCALCRRARRREWLVVVAGGISALLLGALSLDLLGRDPRLQPVLHALQGPADVDASCDPTTESSQLNACVRSCASSVAVRHQACLEGCREHEVLVASHDALCHLVATFPRGAVPSSVPRQPARNPGGMALWLAVLLAGFTVNHARRVGRRHRGGRVRCEVHVGG